MIYSTARGFSIHSLTTQGLFRAIFPGEDTEDYLFMPAVHVHDVHEPFKADSWRFVCVPKSKITATIDDPECLQNESVTDIIHQDLEIKKVWQVVLIDEVETGTLDSPKKKVSPYILWVYTD